VANLETCNVREEEPRDSFAEQPKGSPRQSPSIALLVRFDWPGRKFGRSKYRLARQRKGCGQIAYATTCNGLVALASIRDETRGFAFEAAWTAAVDGEAKYDGPN
jgi:hypothetical protein